MTEPSASEPNASNANLVTKFATEPTPKSEATKAAPAVTVQATPETGAGSKLEAKIKPPPDSTPDVVKRVHALYEQLGREDVQAVQGWDKAHADQKAEVNK
jgi:H+-transporting ATPase